MTHRASAPIGRGLPALWRERPRPVHPLLLAVWPVLFLYGQNVGELQLAELVVPLVVVALTALLFLVAGTVLVRDGRRAALIVSAVALALLLYGHVAELLGPLGPRPWMQQIGWALFVLVVVVRGAPDRAGPAGGRDPRPERRGRDPHRGQPGHDHPRRGRPRSARARAWRPRRSVDRRGPAATSTTWSSTGTAPRARSISSTTSTTSHSSTDSASADSRSLPDSHANYVRTTLSLAATLNLDYLDDVVGGPGPGLERLTARSTIGSRTMPSGDSCASGATSTSTSDPGTARPRRARSRTATRASGSRPISRRRCSTAPRCPAIARRLGIIRTTPDRERRYRVTRFELDTLDQLATEPGPKFVFSHMLIPHPPYIFARDGSFVTDELDAGRSRRGGLRRAAALPAGRGSRPWSIGCWIGRRRSGRSSSCRPTRGRTRRATAATRRLRLGDGDDRRARDQVRHLQRDVPARRGRRRTCRRRSAPSTRSAWCSTSTSTPTCRCSPTARSRPPSKLRPYDLTEITDRLPSLGAASLRVRLAERPQAGEERVGRLGPRERPRPGAPAVRELGGALALDERHHPLERVGRHVDPVGVEGEARRGRAGRRTCRSARRALAGMDQCATCSNPVAPSSAAMIVGRGRRACRSSRRSSRRRSRRSCAMRRPAENARNSLTFRGAMSTDTQSSVRGLPKTARPSGASTSPTTVTWRTWRTG